VGLITIKDVAEKAGVSVATVSRVINNEKYVNEDLRRYVLKIVNDMGYQPDGIARGLRTKSTNVISLVIPDINNPFYPEVARGVQSVADEYEYVVILCNTDRVVQREQKFVNILNQQRVEGIIINPSGSTRREMNILARLNIPVVLISSQNILPNFDIVMVDNIQGVRLAIDHFYELGHRRIGLVGGSREVSSGEQRYQGYIQSIARHGIPVEEELITEGKFDHNGGYECMKRLLKLKNRPTAVFAANDIMAIGAVSAIYETGLKIPDDISIIGFDDIAYSRMMYPKLTTVSQPKFEMGAIATQMLFERVTGQEIPNPRRKILDHSLVIRDTTQRI
jgi:LacI family transcriptional regulator